MLEKLIKDFALYMGMTSDLELDADGAYVLPVNDYIRIRAQQNADNEILLSSILGPLPSTADLPKVHFQLMAANLFGQETGGSSLGIDAEGQVVMMRRIPTQISHADFARNIEILINYSETWMEDLGIITTQEGQ